MISKWTQYHTELQNLMKKEIDVMRELLGNLHQEEMLIIRKEMAYWNQLMEERGHLIQQLSHLRQNRIFTTETLESLNHSHANVPLEELLPPDNENSWELLALRDQIFALLDRMNLQCSRNEMLTQLARHEAVPQRLPEKKAKISIATLPPEDYNNRDVS
jgi:flagellar biosynthesis/type III secretory pathway chaperone